MRMKRILVAVLTLCILATGMLENTYIAKANNSPSITTTDENISKIVKPGETTHIRLPIKAVGNFIFVPTAYMKDESPDSPFIFSKPVLTNEDGESVSIINISVNTYVDFDVTVKETAVIKTYPVFLMIEGSYMNSDGIETACNVPLELKLRILEEKAPAQLTIGGISFKNNTIGSNTEISFAVKNEGEIAARNTYISVNYGDTGIAKNYTAGNIKVGDIVPGDKKLVTLPVSILPTATAGKKTLSVNFNYKDLDGNTKTPVYDFSVEVEGSTKAPQLDIEDIFYPEDLEPGDEFVLKAKLQNVGDATASNIRVSVENTESDNIIKNFYTDNIKIADMKQNGSREVEIPLFVDAAASGNLNKLSIKFIYTDSLGVTYTNTKTLYLKVKAQAPDPEKVSSIVISDVKQSPSRPVAGGDLAVSFDFENKGNADITELKISLENITGSTFIPVNTEPYIYIEKLTAGETRRITIPLKVSDDVPEGLNKLSVKYSYKGGAGEIVDIPVLDVQNDLGSKSIPKVIISNYEADVPELRAGSSFNFTFDLYNTHSSVSAKNITVTVTQVDNVFSPTKGSNSFFIEKIAPGESVQQTLEMKVKSDTKTGTYKLHIDVEYEYDGIEPKENGEIGYTRPYDLNLQAVENARPVVDYVNVYSYDGNVIVGNPAFLSFEFYNMGKSPLNNVVATVEGDFTKADGNMYFIGNVMEGSSMYSEFEVIPNMEGMAKGVLKIAYEDSNGDEVIFTKEFEYMISGMPIFEPGIDGGDIGVFNPAGPTPKKELLKPWLFILIQAALFVIFLPVTRKVIISVYRRKLQKREDAKY